MDYVEKLNMENIELASLRRRSLAYFIDDFLVSILIFIVYFDDFQIINGDFYTILETTKVFIYQLILLRIIYQAIFVYIYGATIGKIIMKIKVISLTDFDKPNFTYSFIRSVVRALEEIVMYIGFLWAFMTPYKKTWHDSVSKTIVVNQ